MKTFTLAILPLALISAFSHAAEEKAVINAKGKMASVNVFIASFLFNFVC